MTDKIPDDINKALHSLGVSNFQFYTTYSSNKCTIAADQSVPDRQQNVTSIRHYFATTSLGEGLAHLLERARRARSLLCDDVKAETEVP